jgi:hypothetical protein
MRAISGLLGLVIAVAIGYFVYTARFSGKEGSPPPKQQIDVTGIRMDLLSLAQAEKRYAALHGSYAPLKQLQQAESVPFQGSDNRGYSYEILIEDAQRFLITARPVDPARADWPTLSIDETGQLSKQ